MADIIVKRLVGEDKEAYYNSKAFIMLGKINTVGVSTISYGTTTLKDSTWNINDIENYLEIVADLSDKDCVIKDIKVNNPTISLFSVEIMKTLITEMFGKLIYYYNSGHTDEYAIIINPLDPIRNNFSTSISESMNDAYSKFCEEIGKDTPLNIIKQ